MKIFRVSTLQPLHKAFLQVNTDLDALAQVLEWFDQFNSPPMPSQEWMQCQLALAEGFTNAVRHAHYGRPLDLLIDLEVQVFSDRMEIRIWDQGDPFDLEKRLDLMPQELDSEAEGGRGLRLMERIADTLSYTRTQDSRNCLLIVKKYLPY
ncbi:MAG: ATP-binding protein [Oscillatoriales cyanobacterium C42_A2020_001]|nr:ATP-binding protein [Leptolyngbyaceae cyanobacterium C42_A2020_001]